MLQAIKQLNISGVPNSSIGVICFFRAQVSVPAMLVAGIWPGTLLLFLATSSTHAASTLLYPTELSKQRPQVLAAC